MLHNISSLKFDDPLISTSAIAIGLFRFPIVLSPMSCIGNEMQASFQRPVFSSTKNEIISKQKRISHLPQIYYVLELHMNARLDLWNLANQV